MKVFLSKSCTNIRSLAALVKGVSDLNCSQESVGFRKERKDVAGR